MVNILVDNFTSLIKYQGGDYELKDSIVNHYHNNVLIRIICDLNINNSTVYSVEDIADFIGNKYIANILFLFKQFICSIICKHIDKSVYLCGKY